MPRALVVLWCLRSGGLGRLESSVLATGELARRKLERCRSQDCGCFVTGEGEPESEGELTSPIAVPVAEISLLLPNSTMKLTACLAVASSSPAAPAASRPEALA